VFLLQAIVPIKGFEKNMVWLDLWLPKVKDKRLHVSFILDNPTEPEWELAKAYLDVKCDFSFSVERVSVNSPGFARNSALHKIEASWICFWDADDYPEVSKIIQVLEGSHEDVVVFNFKVQDVENFGGFIGHHWSRFHYLSLNQIGQFPGFWRMAFRSKTLQNVRFEKFRMGEDLDFLVQVNLQSQNIQFNNEVVYTYRKFVPLSLTQEPKALAELPELIESLESRIKISKMRNSFNYSLYFRSVISSYRYSGRSSGYVIVKLVVRLLSHPWTTVAGILRVLMVKPLEVRKR